MSTIYGLRIDATGPGAGNPRRAEHLTFENSEARIDYICLLDRAVAARASTYEIEGICKT